MEPADIDWKNIESKYVRDDIYEHINAPKWIDLANPDASPIDDEAWFCRPDCRHPKTVEDLQRWTPSPKVKHVRSSSEMLPLGERNGNQREGNNLKRRGIAAFLPSSPLREQSKPKAAAPKKFRDDAENQNPNLSTTPPPPTSRQFGAPKGGKAAKETIKSSTEKKVEEEREEWQQQKKPQPRLKSTLSARNLFSGKDILSQISEFCQELKKLAVRSERPAAQEEANEEVKKVSEAALEEEVEKREKGKTDRDLNSKNLEIDVSEKKSGKRPMRIEVEEHKYRKGLDENPSVLREVRACPPTPQRIPSPSSRRLRIHKATTTASSPLNKPPRSTPQRGILKELEQGREGKRELAANGEDSNNNTSVTSDNERSPMNMFWFLKPCTYLGK